MLAEDGTLLARVGGQAGEELAPDPVRRVAYQMSAMKAAFALGKDHVADHARRLGLGAERPFLRDGKGRVVFDPGHEGRARIQDVAEQFIAGVAAIHHVVSSGLG